MAIKTYHDFVKNVTDFFVANKFGSVYVVNIAGRTAQHLGKNTMARTAAKTSTKGKSTKVGERPIDKLAAQVKAKKANQNKTVAASTKKTPAKKAPAKKTTARKAPAKKVRVERVEVAEVIEPAKVNLPVPVKSTEVAVLHNNTRDDNFGHQPNWRGIGINVDGLTPKQALKKAGLDWGLKREPLVSVLSDGTQLETGLDGIYRDNDNKFFTVATPRWNEFHNDAVIDTFLQVIEDGKMTMDSIGHVDDGQKIFALAKLNSSFKILRDDVIQAYMLLTFCHKYGTSLQGAFIANRLWCANQLTTSLTKNMEKGMGVRINHSKPYDKNVVLEAMEASEVNMDKYKQAAQHLASKRFNQVQLEHYFDAVFPLTSNLREKELSRNATRALAVMDEQPGAESGKGTWWQAYNAATYLVDHEIGHSPETRLNSAWYGPGKTTKIRAFHKALDYANL
jgi:phage/plasmid-like protein (TIGR03299 family)